MATVAKRSLNAPLLNGLAALTFVVLTLVILIVGQPIIMPVALAILFTFILTPVVRLLERMKLGRIAAVCTLVAIGSLCVASLLTLAAIQTNDLVANLPTYWDKADAYARHFAGDNAFLTKLWDQVQQFVKPQLNAGEIAARNPGASAESVPGLGWLSSIPGVLISLLAPLANLVAIIVLTIFMLIFREDIRNRFIGALGETQLLNTTRVMNDTSERLSNYLLGLFSVNFGFSVVLATGLFLLGVPYALVWGVVSFFFRFVPYLGSTLSMTLPLVTSILSQHSWFAAIGVVVLYGALEFTTGNFIEPNLFGNSVGMNPVALLIALMFWAWAWGPIGMAMAIPLTLIIVTLGRHLPCFGALATLAGNSDPLPEHVLMYQRLLSHDPDEPKKIIKKEIENSSFYHATENTLMRALHLAKAELRAKRITDKDYREMEEQSQELVDELVAEKMEKKPKHTHESEHDELNDAESINSRQKLRAIAVVSDDIAAQLGAKVAITATHMIEWEFITEREYLRLHNCMSVPPEIVLVAGAPPNGLTNLFGICRRIRRLGYSGKIIVGYWRRRPLSRQTKRMFTASGADFFSHRIWTVSRLLAHLDEIQDDEHAVKDTKVLAGQDDLVKLSQ
jgi:predicted PurR-regulated permease PerM